ncbi:Arc family DNA-binding protein [Azotobacter beijerinckii]|uniref:Arc-like DNA binding domain-containing protein n=1 Tax=Azotobacter beijerinckii TaxID=170623 RepID=A0A1I4G977_9GAMM|nr:Arc family DNA-binding protein [Azotobacter beijerinckii]SFB46224.1 Arc-like DNA binding domain-containing protein [Azotobacter beijerinckii]SFL26612.1 Arc-like DNA binding domain-containing protein [Azotobacter beijerinckii]
MSREITPFALRMPPELRAKVEHAAKESRRSLNSEIVDRLDRSFGQGLSGISVSECRRSPSSVANALEMIDRLRDELLAIAASPKE